MSLFFSSTKKQKLEKNNRARTESTYVFIIISLKKYSYHDKTPLKTHCSRQILTEFTRHLFVFSHLFALLEVAAYFCSFWSYLAELRFAKPCSFSLISCSCNFTLVVFQTAWNTRWIKLSTLLVFNHEKY